MTVQEIKLLARVRSMRQNAATLISNPRTTCEYLPERITEQKGDAMPLLSGSTAHSEELLYPQTKDDGASLVPLVGVAKVR